MNDVEKKLLEMSSDSRFDDVVTDLKLLRYQYRDYQENKSPDLVDEMLLLLMETCSKIKNSNAESSPINENKFKNPISLAFYKYMVENGLSPKTANDYVKRVNQICEIDKLVDEDVQPYIDEYTVGGKKEDNKRLHNAPSSALKKFNEFKNFMNKNN